MNTSDSGVSDGAVGVDSVWKRKLGKLLAEAPLADSLLEALWPLADLLHGEGMEDLIGIIEDKSAEWCDLIYSPGGGFNLPRTYRLDFAIAIYLYTLAHPSVYSVINKVMFNPARRTPGAAEAAGVSDDLRALSKAVCCDGRQAFRIKELRNYTPSCLVHILPFARSKGG